MLDNGADPNGEPFLSDCCTQCLLHVSFAVRDGQGNTPLMLMASQGKEEAAEV